MRYAALIHAVIHANIYANSHVIGFFTAEPLVEELVCLIG